MRTKVPNTAESVALGYIAGLIFGVLSVVFFAAMAPAIICAGILGLQHVAAGPAAPHRWRAAPLPR